MAKKKSTPPQDHSHPPTNVPIVAIGASAGGQEAVVELLKNLSPTTGLAYVYIQHLDPTQETHLVEILSRATTMAVLEAQHLMRVEANHLYIIPPDRDLEVLDGILTLQSRPASSVIHMPVDQFFLSLAERQKEGAIAIVLSGTASDGTLGLRAIKAAGGITFAQDDSARFLSMPRSAIAEGVVDRVLSPPDIARELERLSSQVSLFQQTTVALSHGNELETSKEEIESTNEELLTINQELQVRNDQLSEAHQFSEDIFQTIREATLVLDAELRVKSANPAFYRLFQLTEAGTDRRLIYELGNRQWDIPELRLMLTDVITSGAQFQGFELTYTSSETGDKILSLNARRVIRQQDSILLAIEDISERRRSQQLLAEREAWFHQIANNAPTLIWVTNAEGQFTFLNKVWLDYTGRSMKDVLEHGWIESLHPDDQTTYQAAYNRQVNERHPFSAEYRLHRRDGEYRWMLENAQPLFTADGTFTGYIGSSADVHLQHELNQELDQRVQTRTEDLAQRTRQLSTLVENTPDVITRWDNELRLLFANSAFVGNTGQPLDSLLGKTNTEMGQPDDVAGPYMAKLQLTFDTGQPQEHYNSFETPTGVVQFYSRIVPEFGPDGAIESVLAIARDITSLQQAERKLAETAHNLQAVLNSSLAAIGFLKPLRDANQAVTDFRLVVCNQEFATMADQTLNQLAGKLISQLSDKLWQEHTVANFRRVLETGDPFYQEQYDPNTDQWMLITLLKYDDGVILTGQDVSLLKKANQQQDQLLSELENSNENLQILTQLRQQIRERGELLRSTSHDLRGNLGIIQGAAMLLNFASSAEEREQMRAMLQRNLEQATQLITEMLDMGRLESGQEERQIAPFDAAELLRELAESIRPLADERNLWLQVDGDEFLPVAGDALKVRRIAQNLLLNAVKYTQAGGVNISWSNISDTDYWQLIISDTGPGLAARAHSYSGEGIGLHIVRQLSKLLNCRIEVDSKAGEGTRFMLWFPKWYQPSDYAKQHRQ